MIRVLSYTVGGVLLAATVVAGIRNGWSHVFTPLAVGVWVGTFLLAAIATAVNVMVVIRQRRLVSASRPGSLVIPFSADGAEWNRLVANLGYAGRFRRGVLAVSGSGVFVYCGVADPSVVTVVPVAAITDLAVSRGRAGIRTFPCIVLTLRAAGPLPVQFAFFPLGRGLRALTTPSRVELGAIVNELQSRLATDSVTPRALPGSRA